MKDKNKPKAKAKSLNLKKEVKVKNARCCTTCFFADELTNITIKCKRHKKKYFSWKICNFYKYYDRIW